MLYFVTAARGTEDFVVDELNCKCQPTRVNVAKEQMQSSYKSRIIATLTKKLGWMVFTTALGLV